MQVAPASRLVNRYSNPRALSAFASAWSAGTAPEQRTALLAAASERDTACARYIATSLAVAPVPFRLANGLRATVARSPDAVTDDRGIRIAAGPVSLMVVDLPGRGPYVLTGTVTLDALAEAAAQLPGVAADR